MLIRSPTFFAETINLINPSCVWNRFSVRNYSVAGFDPQVRSELPNRSPRSDYKTGEKKIKLFCYIIRFFFFFVFRLFYYFIKKDPPPGLISIGICRRDRTPVHNGYEVHNLNIKS